MNLLRTLTNNSFTHSVAARFLRVAVGMAAAIGLALGLYTSVTVYTERVTDLHNAARYQIAVLAHLGAPLIATDDRAELQQLAVDSVAFRFITGVLFADPGGAPVAVVIDGPDNTPVLLEDASVSDLATLNGIQVVQETIINDGVETGRVQIAYSLASARLVALRSAGLTLLGVVSFCVVLVVVTTGLYSRTITKPLNDLERMARLLAEGELDKRAEATRQDEVGRLQAAFNRMADRLQETLEGLNQANQAAAAANQALTEQRDFAVQVLDAMGQGLTVTDMDGYFIYANRAFGRIIGRDPEEVIGATPWAFTLAEDIQMLQAARRDRQAGLKTDYETRLLRSDQTIANVMVTGVPQMRDGRLTGTIAVVTDLTERKAAEEALRRSEAAARKLSAVASRTDNMVIITDAEGRTEWVNDAFTRITGWQLEEVIGYAPGTLLQGPESDPQAVAYMAGCLARKQGFKCELVNYTKDQQPYWVAIEVQPVADEQGAVINYVAIESDITERRKMEQALRLAKEIAEEADRAKTEFLANMSHEIRTPMNAIIGLSGLLLDTRLDSIQRDYIETIRGSGDGLLEIINEILDFSKIEANRLELASAPFELRRCVEEALDLFGTQAGRKNIDLVYFVEPDVPQWVVGDVTRLRQVLVNLVSNAIKFTDHGEIVVLATGRPLHDHQWRLAFRVQDTGIGIPADRVGLLFKPFSQIDASKTRRYSGTGLGLAICRRLVELMGGSIAYEPNLGGGALFRFSIVVGQADSPNGEVVLHPQVEGRHVLIVDDNATHREIVQRHLAAWRIQSETVASPEQALTLLREHPDEYDAAIVDIHMPEMDGLMLASQLRQNRSTAELPLLLLGAAGAGEVSFAAETAIGIQPAAYLNKPLKPSLLFDALVDIFAGRSTSPLRRPPSVPFDETLGQRHPLRILLAEDNVVNQKVALRILERLGYRADVVANGLEVLDALGRQTYDVVLMDVQMPEMDGITATIAIYERYGAQRPRIIALTAHALEGDREQYLKIGMDDYISKPVRIEALISALRRVPGAGREPPPLDLNSLQQRFGPNTHELLDELLPLFIDEVQPLLERCRVALATGDTQQLWHSAHAIKGSALSLGVTEMANAARQLEQVGRSGELDNADALLKRLDTTFAAVRAYQLQH